MLALLLPFTVFFTIGRPIAGLLCLVLQVTLIGWLPATLWAIFALGQYKSDQRIAQAMASAQLNSRD